MRFSRVLGYGLLGIVALGALLLGIVVWRFYVPSADTRTLNAVYEQRPPVPDEDNAFIYLWGFSAPKDVDPLALATKRLDWMRRKAGNPASGEPAPNDEKTDWASQRSPAMGRLAADCRDGASTPCARAFEQWPFDVPFTALESLEASRYDSLNSRRHWREDVPRDNRMLLPSYGDALDGQRLLLLQALAAARAGDSEDVSRRLGRDLEFWRQVLGSSDLLISKVIACVAIRNHFFFGNLAIRALPPERQVAAIPPVWRVPLSAEEQSLLRVFAGEFQWAQGVLRKSSAEQLAEFDAEMDFDDGDALAEQMLKGIFRRFRPWQRRLNQLAALYLQSTRALAVPLDQYKRVTDELEPRFGAASPMAADVPGYAYRVATFEGMRRAALLTAELRGRGVTAAEVSRELAVAALKNPFTGAPFEWDAEQQAVVYLGPEQDRWKRHAYFY